MPQKHVVIVGAGPGGLTSAMILAHRGFKVTVFEQKPEVGGRNAELKIDGYTFDTGPTFLMMNFVLDEMFKEAGRNIGDYLKFSKLEPMYRLKFNDCEVFPTDDHAKMREQIAKLFPGNEKGYDRFLVRENKRYEALFPCLQKHYSTIWTMLSMPLIRAIPHLSITKSLYQRLGTYFNKEKLRLSFTFQSKYIGMAPWECPGLFTMVPYVEHRYGIFHVIGGLNKISQAMAKVADDNGAEIRTNTPVQSLIIKGGKAKGVKLADGTEVPADEVIINADFAHAMSTLVPEGVLKKYSKAKLNKKEYSCSTFMLYLGVKRKYDMPHHNIIFADDYHTNINRIFHEKTLVDDMSFYIQNACATDSTLAPSGKSTIYVLVPVPNRQGNIDWEKEKASFREKVLKKLEERTVMKDIRQQIEVEKIITPADWENDYSIFKGATFNLSHKLSQVLYLRPRNKFEEIQNVYLTGGGTHPGSGLPTIYESARISSNLISKKYGVPFIKPSGLGSKTAVG